MLEIYCCNRKPVQLQTKTSNCIKIEITQQSKQTSSNNNNNTEEKKNSRTVSFYTFGVCIRRTAVEYSVQFGSMIGVMAFGVVYANFAIYHEIAKKMNVAHAM